MITTRHGLLVAAALCVVVVAFLRPTGSAKPKLPTAQKSAALPTPAPPVIVPRPTAPQPPLIATTSTLATSCQLEAQQQCSEKGTCVIVAAMPDLDKIWGWAQLSLNSPGFVAQILAREAGLTMPCSHALSSVDTVLTIERKGEQEIWCVLKTDSASARGLCDTISSEQFGVTGFLDPQTRQLRF